MSEFDKAVQTELEAAKALIPTQNGLVAFYGDMLRELAQFGAEVNDLRKRVIAAQMRLIYP